MFRKANNNLPATTSSKPTKSREAIPTIVTPDVHLLGNMVSEGAIDFSGTIDGNIRCDVLTLRAQGTIKGEISASTVYIQGTVKGLIRAKNVHLHASCHVEGIIIHEQLSIEDGAFVDGKFKRSDRVTDAPLAQIAFRDSESDDNSSDNTGGSGASGTKILENIRLIR